jgi:hypothetical protein
MARGVSSPAGDDKGSSPLTSAAFLKNCCTKKLFNFIAAKIDFRTMGRCPLEPLPKGDTHPLESRFKFTKIPKWGF